MSISITTKTGDTGHTDLMFGGRVSKDDIRIHTVGLADELSAWLGMVRIEPLTEQTQKCLANIQEELIGLMGQCSVVSSNAARYEKAGYSMITKEKVEALTNASAQLEATLPKFNSWVLPGASGNAVAAKLDVARCVCRRAERYMVSLWLQGDPHLEVCAIYLNRLSDFLWVLARVFERDHAAPAE
jgi:cob(I)alamin adenosyltransferase